MLSLKKSTKCSSPMEGLLESLCTIRVDGLLWKYELIYTVLTVSHASKKKKRPVPKPSDQTSYFSLCILYYFYN